MATIGFIGLGNMGGPMAANLIKAGHQVKGYDLSQDAVARLVADGGESVSAASEAAAGVDVVVTMLPAGAHVRSVYLDEGGVLSAAAPGAVFIDCSTIDVQTARDVAQGAADAGFDMVDAPVSGGVAGGAGGTPTFLVGGSETAFQKAEPILACTGKN
ncbi:MAG: NAD(P)-dependent oxidoreductase, partial [Methyloligellaceae bacterium]